MRIFIKKGKPTSDERMMKNALEKTLKEKGISESEFQPASTTEELKALYNKYVPEDAVIESETKNGDKADTGNKKDDLVNDDSNLIEASDRGMTEKEYNESKEFLDPLNRANKKVRDYVLENDFSSTPDSQTTESSPSSSSESIAEPTNSKDAFGIPNAEAPNSDKGNTGASSAKPKEPKPQPVNPAWEDMSGAKKNKSTKRMSKWVVEIFCAFAEKGMILWGTKDINNTKLAEYAITQEIELGIILDDIGDGVQGSVKQFFENTALQIEQVARFTIEEKAEIADALYEFLLEKGIAPNPAQNLAIVMIGTFGVKMFAVYMLVKPVNSVLEQLRAMKQPKQEEEVQEAEDVTDTASEEETPKKQKRKKKKTE